MADGGRTGVSKPTARKAFKNRGSVKHVVDGSGRVIIIVALLKLFSATCTIGLQRGLSITVGSHRRKVHAVFHDTYQKTEIQRPIPMAQKAPSNAPSVFCVNVANRLIVRKVRGGRKSSLLIHWNRANDHALHLIDELYIISLAM